jgi:nucleoid-associated protein YgaU
MKTKKIFLFISFCFVAFLVSCNNDALQSKAITATTKAQNRYNQIEKTNPQWDASKKKLAKKKLGRAERLYKETEYQLAIWAVDDFNTLFGDPTPKANSNATTIKKIKSVKKITEAKASTKNELIKTVSTQVKTVTAATTKQSEKEPAKSIIDGTTKYTVKYGDNLWSIARKQYNDQNKWKLIKKANTSIGNNLEIFVGQELILPAIP